MRVTELTLTDYRNIPFAHFEPAPELTVICGKNGQGKTNLLESVWLLTGGKSFRGAKDAELVREHTPFAIVEGVVEGFGKTTALRVAVGGALADKKGRYAKANGVDYGRVTSLAGMFTAVVFDPGHLSLIKGSPEGRRRFLDAALCQLYPGYIPLLRRYTRIVTQKNALLKAYRDTPGAAEMLDVFDEEMAAAGTQVSCRRQAYLASITPDVVRNYADISSGSEQLSLAYEASFSDDALKEVLRAARGRDLAAGFCTAGPHREDFGVTIDGRDAKIFASQGQQRSAVLSLKLAEAAGAQAVTGEHPVMLLDDVLSELDDTRQAYLLNRMEGRQTIVTACNPALFAATNGKIYKMRGGILTQEN